MIASVQVLFDKDEHEKEHALITNNIPTKVGQKAVQNGDVIKMILLNKISSGKVGSLAVDPLFLHFRALECKFFLFPTILFFNSLPYSACLQINQQTSPKIQNHHFLSYQKRVCTPF